MGDIEKNPLVGPSAAPPPYSYQPVQVQQQQPPATVIYQRKQVGCCGIFCGITAAICLSICACCVLAAIVVGTVFGPWASQCNGQVPQFTLTHASAFASDGSERTVELECHGDIVFQTSASLISSVVTSSLIYGQTPEQAQAARVDFESTPTSFSLKFPYDFWNCPKEDVTMQIQDTILSTNRMNLDASTSSGDITLANGAGFLFQRFSDASFTTSSGNIRLGTIVASGSFYARTASGDVTLTTINATEITARTASGDISATNLAGDEFDVTSSSGSLTGNNIVLVHGTDCQATFATSSGSVLIQNIIFPPTGNCDVEIKSSSGGVTVTAIGFSGTYEVKSSSGQASFNGNYCGSTCTGSVGGLGNHKIEIKTSSGEASFRT